MKMKKGAPAPTGQACLLNAMPYYVGDPSMGWTLALAGPFLSLTDAMIALLAIRRPSDALLVPLIHDGVLVNLQRIRPGGRKRFLPGGKVKGCYSPFGYIADGEPLHICEGWATGATIHESTAAAVAYAMNAGNPLAVGQHLQRRYPDAVLIVADERRPPDTWQPEAHRHDGRRPGRWCLRSSLRRRP